MGKKSSTEKLLEKHYKDMLDLNKDFISAISRPRPPMTNGASVFKPIAKKPISRAQGKALARGRKILAANRVKRLT